MKSTYSNYNDDHDNPLLNTIFTLYIIINLYFPYCLIKLIIFPILISSLILLFILRLGVSQQQQQPQHTSLIFELVARTSLELEPIIINTDSDSDSDPDSKLDLEFTPTLTIKEQVINKNDRTQPEDKPGSMNEEGFVEWTVWAPLGVIYEEDEYEEETKKDAVSYTDTESSSWSFDEEFGKIQRWEEEGEEEEEEEEGMFEIALDYHGICDKSDYFVVKKLRKEIVSEVVDEEDNLIEIDISPSNLGKYLCETGLTINLSLVLSHKGSY